MACNRISGWDLRDWGGEGVCELFLVSLLWAAESKEVTSSCNCLGGEQDPCSDEVFAVHIS